MIRSDDRIELELRMPAKVKTRAMARVFLMQQWGDEAEGRKYRYFAERFADGGRLYLERPGRLNKGCDFVVHLENSFVFKNGNDRPPSHKDLLADLAKKKARLSPKRWRELLSVIRAEHAFAPAAVPAAKTPEGELDFARLAALCRWFFLEQDLTYWNLTGRNMLWGEILRRFSPPD